MDNLDLDLDVDFSVDTSNILSDYTTDQLIDELKKRGAEIACSNKNRGLNIQANKGFIVAVFFRKDII